MKSMVTTQYNKYKSQIRNPEPVVITSPTAVREEWTGSRIIIFLSARVLAFPKTLSLLHLGHNWYEAWGQVFTFVAEIS